MHTADFLIGLHFVYNLIRHFVNYCNVHVSVVAVITAKCNGVMLIIGNISFCILCIQRKLTF